MWLLWNIKKSHYFSIHIYFGTVFLRQCMCVYERYMLCMKDTWIHVCMKDTYIQKRNLQIQMINNKKLQKGTFWNLKFHAVLSTIFNLQPTNSNVKLLLCYGTFLTSPNFTFTKVKNTPQPCNDLAHHPLRHHLFLC